MTKRRRDKNSDPPVPPSPPSPPPTISPSPHPPVPIITLLTDFGTADYFVGSVKGVILSASPDTRIVDITHEIPAHDIEAAAFTLLGEYKSFPKGTVHVAVVDPGVGSVRRGIVVEAAAQLFVGPDNGIFSYLYEREPGFKVFELTNRKYVPEPASLTFHGRDVFAPVAAALANGIPPSEFGRELTNPVRLEPLCPKIAHDVVWRKKSGARAGKSASEAIRGRIIHIDRFGNCITNITPRELTPTMIEGGLWLVVKGKKITSFRNFFAEVPAGKNGKAGGQEEKPRRKGKQGGRADLFCIWGSAGFLEIAAAKRSAAVLLKARRGQGVVVRLRSGHR